MRALPEDLDESAIPAWLAEHWNFEAARVDYAPVGAGSYHWVVADGAGERRFVTVDDLDYKPWLGDRREDAFAGLGRAFETAAALRAAGLGFVVAPLRSAGGQTVHRIGPRYSVALFPFVHADARDEGAAFFHETAEDRRAVLALLAELHRATPAVAEPARTAGLAVDGRDGLESALDDLDEPWRSGPFAEPAQAVVAAGRDDVRELLALADRLVADVASRAVPHVITHGEPHVNNVLRAGSERLLIDWDTVGLAPPERDLWMLVDDGGDLDRVYSEATGYEPDERALTFYRLAWDLSDLASYLGALRAPHERSEDTERALRRVTECVRSRAQWAALLDS
jgi:spectinomycin phosphotransferase